MPEGDDPIHDISAAHDQEAWVLDDPEPTALVALWPDDDPPLRTEILAALERECDAPLGDPEDAEMEEEFEHDGEDTPTDETLWSMMIEVPGLATPIAFWVEPARPDAAEELDDPEVRRAKWVVGAETILDRDDPLSEYIKLVRLLAGAISDTPAMLDLNSTKWYRRRELRELFMEQVEPPSEILWVIHAVHRDDGIGGTWLHTHGLWRCGQPELEMINVPRERMAPAGDLLNDIAALMLEHPLPPPGEPYEIGSDLMVTVHPWESIAGILETDAPGSMSDRTRAGMEAHVGLRAVVCARRPKGIRRKSWPWPEEVVDRLENDTAVVYRTRRATERQSRLAQQTWDQVATAFASCRTLRAAEAGGDDGIIFLIKAGYTPEDEDDVTAREHLWFEVRQFDAHRAEAELVNDPLSVPQLTRGDVVWVQRDQLSDWCVMTRLGSFGPSDIAAVWRAIDTLRNDQSEGAVNNDGG